MAKEWDVGL